MGHRDRLTQHVEQCRGELLLTVFLAVCLSDVGQPLLDELQVPVAQLAVDEVIEAERGMGEVVLLDARGGVGLDPREPREDPAILDCARQRLRLDGLCAL